MYLADYHVHTSFSNDCNIDIEDIIYNAIKKNMKEIAITDHVDIDYPKSTEEDYFDFDEYFYTIKKLRDYYKNKIDIIFGVELGLQTHIKADINKFVNKYPLDFIIGSIHTVDYLELHNGDFFIGKKQKESYLRYFEIVLENVKNFDEYDVVGHLDYIIRYGNYEKKQLRYNDYSDIIDEILKIIITKDKGIEVNTSGYKYNLNVTHPQYDIVKRYKELGGKIITIGSDSHHYKTLCSNFDIAYDLIKEVGFKEITLFRNRKPLFKKIL